MASTTASVSPAARDRAHGEVLLLRLYVLRATYLLLVVGRGAVNVPDLLSHDPSARGVIPWGYVYRHFVKMSGPRWR